MFLILSPLISSVNYDMLINNSKHDMRYLREKAELRAVDVASLIGVGESTVRNWEKGRTEPTLKVSQVLKLCKIYKCSLEELDEACKKSMNRD